MFVLWFAATLGMLGGSFAAGGIKALDVNEDPNGPQLESEVAFDVFGGGEPALPRSGLSSSLAARGRGARPGLSGGGPELVADLRAARATVDGVEEPTFDEVIDPFVAGPSRASSRPTAPPSRLSATSRASGRWSSSGSRPCRRSSTRRARGSPTATVHVVTSTFINNDIEALINEELDGSLRLTIPVTFLILLLAFGAIAAALCRCSSR